MEQQPVFFSNGDPRIEIFNEMSRQINNGDNTMRNCETISPALPKTRRVYRRKKASEPNVPSNAEKLSRETSDARLANLEAEVAALKTKIGSGETKTPMPFFE